MFKLSYDRWLGRVRVLVAVLVLALAGAYGCGSDGSAACEEACSLIYDTCGLVLIDGDGNQTSKSFCVGECSKEAPSDQDQALSCVKAAGCDENQLGFCVGV